MEKKGYEGKLVESRKRERGGGREMTNRVGKVDFNINQINMPNSNQGR